MLAAIYNNSRIPFTGKFYTSPHKKSPPFQVGFFEKNFSSE
jgi:hypothetical protein